MIHAGLTHSPFNSHKIYAYNFSLCWHFLDYHFLQIGLNFLLCIWVLFAVLFENKSNFNFTSSFSFSFILSSFLQYSKSSCLQYFNSYCLPILFPCIIPLVLSSFFSSFIQLFFSSCLPICPSHIFQLLEECVGAHLASLTLNRESDSWKSRQKTETLENGLDESYIDCSSLRGVAK